MSVESFFTTLVSQPGAQSKASGSLAFSGANEEGAKFLDFILGQLEQLEQNGENAELPNGAQEEALQSDNPLLDKEISLEIAKILADNPEIAEQVENFGLSEGTAISETLALNQQAFDEILRPVLSPELKEKLESMISAKASEIEAGQSEKSKLLEQMLLNEENLKGAGLITSDLTPEQLFDLKQQIQEIMNTPSERKNNEQPVAGLFAGLIQLVAPQAQAATQAATGNAALASSNLALKKQEFDLATRLNNLTPGGTGEGIPGTEKLTGETDFERIMSRMKSGKNIANTGAQNIANGNNAPTSSPDLSFIQGWSVVSSSGLMIPSGFVDEYASAGSPLQSVTNLSAFTELVTQAQHAARPHPATQMVASSIQKNALSGTSKEVVLQLDPPELGKLRINMEFGKDKTVKASIIAEKPETYMMLQRDAQTLERILQDVGLDAQNGLSFEMAEEGFDFNDRGHNTKQSAGSNGRIKGDEDSLTLETTMTWHVDPETGHMRYNLVA